MKKISILRADFYSNNVIIPISVTYSDGKTDYVKSIIGSRRIFDGKGQYKILIDCNIGTRKITIEIKNLKWKVIT